MVTKPKILLFLASLTALCGCECVILCEDQTMIQHDYVHNRDHCREYAELKFGMSAHGPSGDRSRKTQLVSLFSECMNKNGWEVPSVQSEGGGEEPPLESVSARKGAPTEALPVDQGAERAAVTRNAECNFARHAASVSANAAARARACDLECEQRLRAAPDGPRPAACPADPGELPPRRNSRN